VWEMLVEYCEGRTRESIAWGCELSKERTEERGEGWEIGAERAAGCICLLS